MMTASPSDAAAALATACPSPLEFAGILCSTPAGMSTVEPFFPVGAALVASVTESSPLSAVAPALDNVVCARSRARAERSSAALPSMAACNPAKRRDGKKERLKGHAVAAHAPQKDVAGGKKRHHKRSVDAGFPSAPGCSAAHGNRHDIAAEVAALAQHAAVDAVAAGAAHLLALTSTSCRERCERAPAQAGKVRSVAADTDPPAIPCGPAVLREQDADTPTRLHSGRTLV